MKWLWLLLAVVAAILLAPIVFPPGRAPTTATAEIAMPWQVEIPGTGQSRVFGLVLGAGEAARPATLADARRTFGGLPTLAIVAPGEAELSLEAYFDTVSIGPLGGKLVLTLDIAAEALAAMRGRAAKIEHMETGVRRYRLNEADASLAETLALRAISFIPAASLDAAVVVQRFGEPAERVAQGETLTHFLYPGIGLDLVLDSKGKEVLQYVAPAQFSRLADPLRGNTTAR